VWNNKGVNYPLGVFAVADGMGGHSAGEVASGLALQAVAQSALEYLLSPEADDNLAHSHAQWVEQAVAAANRAVHDQVEARKSDMGTTLVLSLLVGDQLFLANVGDSRAYLIDGQGIRQLTEDHSLVERLVASGQISRSDARLHPQRNVIYRTIGDRGEVEVDSWRLTVKAGDRLLLCSDGLSTMVDDKRIYRLVSDARLPQPACDALIKAANEAGGADNITAVIIQILALT
jgi:protein phosphatase